jgi:type IV secretory pathway TrbF-like protein
MDLKSATPTQIGAELSSRDIDFILLVDEGGTCHAYSSPNKDSDAASGEVFTQVRDFLSQLKVQGLADWEKK